MDSKQNNILEQASVQPHKNETISETARAGKKRAMAELFREGQDNTTAADNIKLDLAELFPERQEDTNEAKTIKRAKAEKPPKRQDTRKAKSESRELTKTEKRILDYGRIGQWFQILCWKNIPIFGFFYMLALAIRKTTPIQKKSFAIAYIMYRILVLLLALTILFVLYKVGLSFISEILRYAGL